ncbi:MAG TPA: stage II sporulation protein R [Candidatus Limivivens merdigallinarum]|uniref:Stage II sporulation protein R n=1 Tax=Candidatus Limivivens merdigallinarum TaxID=2840859 RepID=A0A9D0ZY72_9FIRM|nr:stage II sporulation protein R [Candidatus Limivivens merdigallinarum]
MWKQKAKESLEEFLNCHPEGLGVFVVAAAAFLVLLCMMITSFGMEQGERSGVEDRVLRFHVIANSDSEEDQRVKLLVKDRVVEELQEAMVGVETLEESKAVVRQEMEHICDTAEAVLHEEGIEETVTVQLEKTYFPVKSYGDLIFPAGEYEALKIVLGEGEGKNWWCVLFPGLCFVDTIHGVVPKDVKEELVVKFKLFG